MSPGTFNRPPQQETAVSPCDQAREPDRIAASSLAWAPTGVEQEPSSVPSSAPSAPATFARRLGPLSIGPHNTYVATLNRNKRNLVLDLAAPAGQAALHDLCRTMHALLSTFRHPRPVSSD